MAHSYRCHNFRHHSEELQSLRKFNLTKIINDISEIYVASVISDDCIAHDAIDINIYRM
jgi:hypothetical protein